MDDIVNEIIKSIEDITDIPAEDIRPDSLVIDDLDLSSIEILSVISEASRKYSVKLTEQELMQVKSVLDLAELIKQKCRKMLNS